MIDQVAAETIEDVLDSYITDRGMFTALDISKGVQQKLKAAGKFSFEDHRHLAIKEYIHEQCDAELDNSWMRTTIKIENVDVRPFVYYPVELNPANYVTKYPVTIKKPDGATVAQQFQVLGPAMAAVKVPGTCLFNSSDYLHVPRRIVRSMGLNAGDVMHVIKDGDGVAILKNLADNQTSLKSVNIDNRHYLRMKRNVISALGLQGTAFTVSQDGGKITIKVQLDANGNAVPASATN